MSIKNQATATLGSFAGEQDVFEAFDRKRTAGKTGKTGKNKVANDQPVIYSAEPYASELYNLIVAASGGSRINTPKVGDVVEGTVARLTPREVAVDFGGKDYAYVDLRGVELPFATNLRVGDAITALVTDVVEEPYTVGVSLAKMQAKAVLNELHELFATSTPVGAVITGMNPGGYLLDVTVSAGTATLFMPHMMAGVNKLSDATSLVGSSLSVILDSYSEDRGTYIPSRKKYLETLIPAERAKLRPVNFTEEPEVYHGIVTGATNFGVFVEFNGCLTGMIHKANIHPDNINPEEIATIAAGTPIDFYVKEIAKGGRIILTQLIRESLWDTIRAKQKLVGKVRDVKHFGVLVKLDDETTGLIHTSELARASKTPEDFKRDQDVDVRVLMVNKGERKIFLALA